MPPHSAQTHRSQSVDRWECWKSGRQRPGCAARVRVEGLREEVARLAGVLEAAEIELDRRVIAREELVKALAASASETTCAARKVVAAGQAA
ncbi:hypothetical protein ACFWOJ_37425 [Streptomyces sp. NPDC058439]|uniref:hypothetical protein n=1 Tax=Streptomyces sp. NPDC058439 TaxID=3346500 RepID=UPI0036504E5E